VALPALGFAIGDVVIGDIIRDHASARAQMEKAVSAECCLDIYVVIAKEERRSSALSVIQELRDRGYRVEYPFEAAKVPKQFQTAEQLGARLAILFGDEWPNIVVKNLATGQQRLVAGQELIGQLAVDR
jgi:histidyl-tRNA synthetase